MTTRPASTIMRIADPGADVAITEAWSDAEGRATYEQIVADAQPAAAIRPPRHRRRVLIGVGLAAAAGAAVAVVGLPGPSHNGAPAAWSVTKNADSTVTVTLSDYRDPAGLQARLRAAGLRADVITFTGNCGTVIGAPDQRFANVSVDSRGKFTPRGSWRSLISTSDGPVFDPRHYDANERVQRVGATVVGSSTDVSFTLAPALLPEQYTVTIGFPANRQGRGIAIMAFPTGTATGPGSEVGCPGAVVVRRPSR